MAKVTNPLISIAATGSVGHAINFQNQHGLQIARQYQKTNLKPSTAQANNRNTYKNAITAWHELAGAQKIAYKIRAKPLQITGFNLFVADYFTSQQIQPGTVWDAGATTWDAGATTWDN